ncbi:MAG TPA: four-carbon acid sugar kinase family protein [Chryseolinea sp.]
MCRNLEKALAQLPSEYSGDLLPAIRAEFLREEKTICVFDDDPTGTQTCHDVTVLTSWRLPLLVEELHKKPSILFILTNSRSFSTKEAVALTTEAGRNLLEAGRQTGRKIIAISRSDSTLRGHFPHEVDSLASAMELDDAVWILIPAFIEGGRFTIDDVHYIVEQGELVPVSDTPFARDAVFGYQNSNLKEWVQEKSEGKIGASEIISCSLEDIRVGGPEAVAKKLLACRPRNVVIVNATSYGDLEVLAMAVLHAERKGRTFLFRSSATFVPIRAGIKPGKILAAPRGLPSTHGSLIVVGSYVPKTTSQLEYLLQKKRHESIEINVTELVSEKSFRKSPKEFSEQTDHWLSMGKDVLLYTSRELKIGPDASSSLSINSTVSSFLVEIVKGLSVQPAFLLAKGGITSSDLASKALSSESATILGQAMAGVPVWKLDTNSKFPEMTYIVFPGNVGDSTALYNVWNKFKSPA